MLHPDFFDTACLHRLGGSSEVDAVVVNIKESGVTSPARSEIQAPPQSYATSPYMILTLSSESVRNTVFTEERGLPAFKSATPFRLGVRTTTISRQATSTRSDELPGTDPDPIQVVGRIEWHCFGSSIFTVGGRTLESNVFLPRHGFFGMKRTFSAEDGRRYRWDMSSRDVVLSLDEPSRTQIARYHRASLGIIGKRRSATLEIAPQAEHMLDLVVLTFIYVEKLRMDKEKRRRRAMASGGLS